MRVKIMFHLWICQTLASFLIHLAQLLLPHLHYSRDLTWQICSGEECSLGYSVAVQQNLQTLVQVPQHEVGEEGDVVFACLLSLVSQLCHHVSVTSSCGQEQETTVVLGLVQTLLSQLELGLSRGQLGQLLPLLLAPTLPRQTVASVQVSQLYCQIKLVLRV